MGLFNTFLKPGKGVTKADTKKTFGLRRFFSTFSDKFWRLVTLNLLFFLVNLPIFGLFARLAVVGGVPYQTPTSVLFQPLAGVMQHTENPAFQALYGVVGIQVEHKAPSTITHILLLIGLLTLVTFGLGTAAMTYVQRNFVKGTPVEMPDDFFLCIKKNWKQAILLGIVDLFFVFVIFFDITSYLYASQSFGMLLLLYASGFISILYLLMRPYMYLMSVTFDIKLSKILKNSWILAVSGIGRNILWSLPALLILILNVLVFNFIPSLGVGMFFIFIVSLAWFFQIYGAWPVLKKHMIDPFYEETEEEIGDEEAVFQDRG